MFGAGGKKIKLEGELLRKVEAACSVLQCGVDEFVSQTLEREADKVILTSSKKDLSAEELAQIENSLKGLGYLE